ncbi:MAG: hypothetical protein WBM50_22500 [Acidimicrobiales bacterium]
MAASALVSTHAHVSEPHNPFYWGAGNIVADPADVATFYSALLGGQLLEPESLADMASGEPDSVPGPGLWSRNYSCGVTHGHDGTVPGYNADVQVLDNGRTVVLYDELDDLRRHRSPRPLGTGPLDVDH